MPSAMLGIFRVLSLILTKKTFLDKLIEKQKASKKWILCSTSGELDPKALFHPTTLHILTYYIIK